jgi:hypothetical protein
MGTRCVLALAVTLVIANVMGCSEPSRPAFGRDIAIETPDSATSHASKAHPLPLAGDDVVRRVQQSFLAVDGEHLGGAATWTTRITTSGEIGFAPRSGTQAAPLRVRSSVAREGVADRDEALVAAPRVEADGTLVLERRTHLERLRADTEGLAQSWSFDTRPPGQGDLVVRVQTSGQDFRGITASGAHFVDDSTTLGTCYGHATWIDGRGVRTRVDARFDERHAAIVLAVPTDVVDGSTYPAVLDPIVSPEQELDAPVLGGQTGEQTFPAIAYGGGVFLIAWQDQRFDPKGDIIAARVTAAGSVIDPGGVPISMSFQKDRAPAVAFDGTNFLVAFESGAADPIYPDIYASFVDPSGVIGVQKWFETGNHSERVNPAVAFDGTNYLIVWEDREGVQNSINFIRLSTSGVWLSGPTPIPGGGNKQQFPSVAYGNSKYLVGWQDFRTGAQWDVYGARVDLSGNVLDNAGGFAISAGPRDEVAPALASDNTTFLATWADSRNGNADIYSSRIDAQGVVLNPSGTAVSTAPGRQAEPAIAWSGARYLAAWHDERNNPSGDIYATTLLATGAVLFPAGIAVSSAQNEQARVAIASGPSCFRLAWDDLRTPSWRKIWSSCVTDAGVVNEPSGVFVGAAANNELRPAIARGVTSQLAVWADDRNGAWDIYGVRVDDTAAPIGGSFPIAAGSSNAQFPSVVFNGTNWIVVWQDDRNGTSDIYGARVSQLGSVLDPSGVAIAIAGGAQTRPDIAWNGSNQLVVWADARNGNSDVYGARTTTSLGALDPAGIPLATGAVVQEEPAVAALAGRYLVVWQAGNYPQAKIRGVRVTGSGTLTPPEFLVTQAHADFREADIDTDGVHYMVVAREDGTRIDAVRVSTGGSVLTVPPAYTLIGDASDPAIRFDGTRFLVAAMRYDSFFDDSPNIVAMRVSTAAAPLDASPLLVADSSDDEHYPAVAAVDSHKWALVYQRQVVGGGTGAWRARARLVTY